MAPSVSFQADEPLLPHMKLVLTATLSVPAQQGRPCVNTDQEAHLGGIASRKVFELFETFDEGHAVIFADAVDYDVPVSCVTDEMGLILCVIHAAMKTPATRRTTN